MEYVYGAMLLHSAGQKINEANLKKVMTASGIKPEAARIKALIASLEEVNIDEAISTAAPISTPVAPAAGVPAAADETPPKEEAKAKEEKKEKKEGKEKKSEEEAAAGLAGLFG